MSEPSMPAPSASEELSSPSLALGAGAGKIKLPIWLQCVVTSVVATAAWIPCEVLGGLFFLAPGVRLWRYYVTPLFWDLTSPTVWAILLPVLGGLCSAYLIWEAWAGVRGWKRWVYRGLFLMVMGPINELIWNGLVWWWFGAPLYLYTVLPTFDGSGSWLSPAYYLTLLFGFWLDEQIPGTLAYGRHRA